MSKQSAKVSTRAAALVLGLASAIGVWNATIASPVAQAQNFGQRTILGIVSNDAGKPVVGATVFLKNVKTHSVKSYTTQAGGAFRFAQVGMVDDYEVWAEHGKTKSGVKTVSSFDSRKEMSMELKLK